VHRVGDHVGELVVRGSRVHVVDVGGRDHFQLTAGLGVIRRFRRRRELRGGLCDCVAGTPVVVIVVVTACGDAEDERDEKGWQQPPQLRTHLLSFRLWFVLGMS
jgi:hypothetical protein